VDENRGRVLSSGAVTRTARAGLVAWSLIGVAILGYLVFRYVLYPVRVVFPPLVVALVFVYLLNPIVRRLERRMGRIWALLLTYLVLVGILVVALRFLIPVVADQVGGFAKSVPLLLAKAEKGIEDLAARFNFEVNGKALFESLQPKAGGGQFIQSIFSVTAGVLHAAVVFVLGPILAFYLLLDLPKLQRGVKALIPARRRGEVDSILEKVSRAIGGFFRGQLLVALFVGIASAIGLLIVGLPYWALVGLIAGLFNLIPLVGPFIGAIPALFIAFTTSSSGGLLHLQPGLPLAVGASIALLVVQQIDNHIISPNVVARTVKLHPVTVMLGLLVGGTLLGLWGMLLAVPLIATVKILLLHYWDTRMQWPPPGETPASPPQDRTDPAGDGIPVEPEDGGRARRPLREVLRRRPAAAGRSRRGV
jgi:predicted PurR-regulated permease PerM